jgi:hypothetical protein
VILKALPLTSPHERVVFYVPYRREGRGGAELAHIYEKQQVELKMAAHRISICVNLTVKDKTETNKTFYFPAILDTGHNGFFAMRSEHLQEWVNLDEKPATEVSRITIRNAVIDHSKLPSHQASHNASSGVQLHPKYTIPVHNYKVWIFSNKPHTTEVDLDRVTPLSVDGVAVYPPEVINAPSIPILGIKALQSNHLLLAVDGKHRLVTLTRRRPWHSALLMV